MSYIIVKKSKLDIIGNALRTKLKTSSKYTVSAMASALHSLVFSTHLRNDYSISAYLSIIQNGSFSAFYSAHLEKDIYKLPAFFGAQIFSTYSNGIVYAMNPALVSSNIISFPNCLDVGKFAFINNSYISSVNLEQCKTISEYAFCSCSNLIDIKLSECEYIGHYAFHKCIKLRQLTLKKCEYIGNYAFQGCHDLQVVSCDALNQIPQRMCVSLENLQSAYFHTCDLIGHSAFLNCTLLSDISFPNCTIIGTGAFNTCIRLSRADLSNVKAIFNEAFANCEGLETGSFKNCTFIGKEAFKNCTLLQSIFLLNETVCSIHSMAFDNTPIISGSGYIYVPTSLITQYKEKYSETAFADHFGVYTGA